MTVNFSAPVNSVAKRRDFSRAGFLRRKRGEKCFSQGFRKKSEENRVILYTKSLHLRHLNKFPNQMPPSSKKDTPLSLPKRPGSAAQEPWVSPEANPGVLTGQTRVLFFRGIETGLFAMSLYARRAMYSICKPCERPKSKMSLFTFAQVKIQYKMNNKTHQLYELFPKQTIYTSTGLFIQSFGKSLATMGNGCCFVSLTI